jgi:hypothetical protein
VKFSTLSFEGRDDLGVKWRIGFAAGVAIDAKRIARRVAVQAEALVGTGGATLDLSQPVTFRTTSVDVSAPVKIDIRPTLTESGAIRLVIGPTLTAFTAASATVGNDTRDFLPFLHRWALGMIVGGEFLLAKDRLALEARVSLLFRRFFKDPDDPSARSRSLLILIKPRILRFE